jgi:hypothetical protein
MVFQGLSCYLTKRLWDGGADGEKLTEVIAQMQLEKGHVVAAARTGQPQFLPIS